MDGVIVVDSEEETARCTLFRYLEAGDQVVTAAPACARCARQSRAMCEGQRRPSMNFLSWERGSRANGGSRFGGPDSWEMHRIREQGGRIVVVAGPVVIHTGAANTWPGWSARVTCSRCWAERRGGA